ncbi:MAG: CBS domain-containing protein [Betaproteobacteria bacterium]|nr:CBS domain-containing protein [Betaproteobacteria bacterium]
MSESPSLPDTAQARAMLAGQGAELARHAPFSAMTPSQVSQFIEAAQPRRFTSGAVVLQPADGPVQALLLVREGSITGSHGLADTAGPFEYVAGDLFPVGAVLGQRAVTATYTANDDSLCLALPAAEVQRLAAASPAFADFLNRRVMDFLALSKRALQRSGTAHALDARLSSLPRKQSLTCSPATPLAQALAAMHERGVGSVLVTDDAASPLGILTRHDILGRVTLPQRALTTPIAEVMSTPLQTLTTEHTLQDAALVMARHGIRHLPVTEGGRVVNIVSERDLFALQRLSLKQLSTQIRAAPDVDTLRHLAGEIRALARNLLGQGVQARQTTELISHLNDVLTERLVLMLAARRGMDMGQACWLAFGSEGRGEQTVATDQDNGLVFASRDPATDRPQWLALARDVNEALDACGYPLCKGQVMASNPECCLTADEWHARFSHWIEHGAPEDLLKASIYFDLRPLCGNAALAQALQAMPAREAARVPRFLKQLAGNTLRYRVPLNWRGAFETQTVDGREMLDLKLHGTAIFVDAARLFALAQGLPVLGTRARLEAAAPGMRVAAREGEAWVSAFEFLQGLRLRVQVAEDGEGAAPAGNPNMIEVATLDDIERSILKEAMRVARRLLQRVELDYGR